MAKPLSFDDAVRLLQTQEDSPLGEVLAGMTETLVDSVAPTLSSVMKWLEITQKISEGSQKLLGRFKDQREGLTRFSRSQRIEAAYRLIIITSFFDALSKSNLAEHLGNLGITRNEQLHMARFPQVGTQLGSLTERLLEPINALPRPYPDSIDVEREVASYYVGLSDTFHNMLQGLSAWSQAPSRRQNAAAALIQSLPEKALQEYKDSIIELGQKFPEVHWWKNRFEHQHISKSVREVELQLDRLLNLLEAPPATSPLLDEVAIMNAAILDRPLIDTGSLGDGLRVPALGEGYVSPAIRTARLGRQSSPSQESWWSEQARWDSLDTFMAAHLTTTDATERPLLLLGAPGSGKSTASGIVAARLPRTSFTVLRVALRNMPPGSDLWEQVELCVRNMTGRKVGWVEVAEASKKTVRVIILDGLDEILLAGDAVAPDYLDQLIEAQDRERRLGRPVSIIVTCRTAVLNRVALPEGLLATKLEDFDEARVREWLAVWNKVNADYFRGAMLKPLTWERVNIQMELARHPILLLMLAIYDAEGNALRAAATMPRAALYEHLVQRFVRREVVRIHSSLPGHRLQSEVEAELERLSVTALAMHNRRTLWIRDVDLDEDFKNLFSGHKDSVLMDGPSGLSASRPSNLLGRFFFVHRSSAHRRSDGRGATYEFAHATFQEFFIARWLWLRIALANGGKGVHDEEVVRLPASWSVREGDACALSLISCSPVLTRLPILNMLSEIASINALEGQQRSLTEYIDLLTRAHEGRCMIEGAYNPLNLTQAHRHSCQTLNILVVLLCVRGRLQLDTLRFSHRAGS